MEVARDKVVEEITKTCMNSPTCSQLTKKSCREEMLSRPPDRERQKLLLSQ